MRALAICGWSFALAALALMLVGHAGAHQLSWSINQLSTYAARAPLGAWVTASMVSSALALGCVGLLVSRHRLLGAAAAPQVVPLLIGAAIGGLLLLAVFQEARPGLEVAAARQQAFHEAGLLLFLVASWLAVGVSGALVAWGRAPVGERLLGAGVACLAPLSFAVMSPLAPSVPVGLRQRAGLLCLWLALALLLVLAVRRSPASARRVSARLL